MAVELKLIDEKCWQISPYLAEYLSVQEGEKIWLHAGDDRCQVTVQILDNYPCMNLYQAWANDLRVSPGMWKVRRTQDGIRLGPIIGIVCQKLPSLAPADSTWIHYFSQLEGGQLILITPEGFDLRRRCVFGSTLSSDKKEWISTEAPWPDVLYVRTYPISPSFQVFLQSEFTNCYFNSQTLFNKWAVYKLLSQKKEIKPYLPDTAILEDNPKQLKNWVNKYSAVYIKPLYGHKGEGVIKIALNQPDRSSYKVQYRNKEENVNRTLSPTLSIRDELTSSMGKRPYLVQQGIALPIVIDQASDFRVLLQKKDDGQWHMTGLGGRRGAEGSIVTNIYNGGERIHLSDLLRNDPLSKAERMKEIHTLCLTSAFTLEQHLGMLGEIGFDLCIDRENHLWLLEVNALPAKTLFTEFYSPSVAKSVYSAPLLYASYLCGFSDVINPMA